MTILKMRYTIFSGLLYLHNGFVQSKQRFGEFLSSTLLNPKETEYKAEDINAEFAHPSNDGVKGRCMTCRKSMSLYHAWNHSPE